MAERISQVRMYSSAVCERAESPGPNFNDGNGIRAWSDSVGEPNGRPPRVINRCTMGCDASIPDGLSRTERGVSLHQSSGTDCRISESVSSLE